MTNEHPAVVAFRSKIDRLLGTTSTEDRAFAQAVRESGVDVAENNSPHLHKFMGNVAAMGCCYTDCEALALADYDRLIAARTTPTEHPDIAAYRAIVGNGDTPTNEEDEAFIRAILADPRIIDALVNWQWDDERHAALCLGVANFLNPNTDGDLMDETATLAAYDAIVGNVKPVVEQVKAAEAKLGDSLNGMARTLDTLAEEFRRIADSL